MDWVLVRIGEKEGNDLSSAAPHNGTRDVID
jgi:hypothetical protein